MRKTGKGARSCKKRRDANPGQRACTGQVGLDAGRDLRETKRTCLQDTSAPDYPPTVWKSLACVGGVVVLFSFNKSSITKDTVMYSITYYRSRIPAGLALISMLHGNSARHLSRVSVAALMWCWSLMPKLLGRRWFWCLPDLCLAGACPPSA